MDFTIKKYKHLLFSLQSQDFSFQTFHDFINNSEANTIILRHDVDKLPQNSLQFAQIQHELGIQGSYYFRIVLQSLPDRQAGFNPKIIEQVAKLGHEIGYHYEDVDLASLSIKYQVSGIKTKEEKEKIIVEKAIELFEEHLAQFRKYYPVKIICMHGSLLSKYDNKLLWKYYDYKDLGIIGEPYFDIDFNEVFYLTDTGRRWDGDRVSIRDKVSLQEESEISNRAGLPAWGYRGERWPLYHSTHQIIDAINSGTFPQKAMITFHPQRWTNQLLPWTKELVWQNVKNVGKKMLISFRK